MQDFSQTLLEKSGAIAHDWIDAVAKDRQIPSANHLSPPAIEDHIDQVLRALASVLAQNQDSNISEIVEASFAHGSLRADQGFDPAEIAREYHLLRSTIFTSLQEELLQGTAREIFRAIRMIDAVIDTAISQCFKSYVEERVRELQHLQQELNLTVQELSRLVRASQENVSLLAHELKTPLTAIIGYAELYIRKQKLQVKGTITDIGTIERIIRAGYQLLHLINDALELSRAEGGRVRLKPIHTNVYSVVKAVLEVMQPIAEDRGLELILNCVAAPEEVLTDPLRLQQILMNLISNAIRYTESGSVKVECRLASPNTWAVSVTDTGFGISTEDQARIFDPFTRAEASEISHPADSTGLGLSIVERLVELLQGRIYLASQVGEGSTFTVIFPLEVKLIDDLENELQVE